MFNTKLLMLIGIGFYCCTVSAQDSNLLLPLHNSNNNPFTLVHDMSNHLNQSATHAGGFSRSLQLSTANLSSNSDEGAEIIQLDGEVTTLNLQLGYSLTPQLRLALSSSLVQHSGGNLDGLIEDWHELWGLPNGNRQQFEQNKLIYRYQNNDELLVNFDRPTTAISDTIVSLGWSFRNSGQWHVQTAIKLPTGDVPSLSGSGKFAAALSVTHYQIHHWFDQMISTQSQLGFQHNDDSDLLPAQLKDSVAFANFNMAWQAFDQLSLKMQLHSNSAFYQSKLVELGKSRLQLVLGGTYQVSKRALLDFSFSEDLTVDASPDVTFSVGLQLLK